MNEKLLEQKMNNMLETNEKEHKQILDKLDRVCARLDNLPSQFPTRTEYTYAENRITALENALKGAGTVVGIAVLGALLKLIIL